MVAQNLSPKRLLVSLALVAIPLALAVPAAATNTMLRFDTSLGTFDVELYDSNTPQTVQNFLNYVNRGDYDTSFFHRLASGFVLQGGGFQYHSGDDSFWYVPEDPNIPNEFILDPGGTNVLGTLAMAKLGGDPDSATNQFFFNLGDNSANLDNQNGGFTVFGRVVPEDMDVIYDLAGFAPNPYDVQVWNASTIHPAWDQLPLAGYINDGRALPPYMEIVNSVTVIPEPATLCLCALGGLALLRGRRRR